MGLQLDCPLCCSETFSCHNSLKYHLLSIIDNLLCPACQRRFDSVFELAMHLGRQCVDEVESPPIKINNQMGNKGEHTHTQTETEFVSCNSFLTQEACAQENDTDLSTSNQNSEVDVTNSSEQSNVDQYYCSSCNIDFVSVEAHIQEFHSGEEIVFAQNVKDDQQLVELSGKSDDSELEEEQEDAINANTSFKSARLLNTIQEEDCVDKDGRLYTRKVVKIEKFWKDADVNKSDVAKLPLAENHNGLIQNLVSTNENKKVLEIYECSKCEMKFLSVKQFYKHKCCGRYKTCNLCNSHFVSLKFLKVHMKMHHKKNIVECAKNANGSFTCEICNTEFARSKSLRLHRRMHDPIKCKEIDPPVTYGKEGEYLTETDAPRKMFLCQICNKSYDKEYEDAHNQFHNNEADFNCEICNRKFYTQENLDMHMHAHSDVKKFLCPTCKKAFLTEEKLQAHKPAECQKRQYECQYCGRRFARPHEKVKHERIHTGEKPHICEICGKAFRVSYCLTLHMRTHSGTRPYHCEICGKRFKAHSVFSHHLLTHSNDRKYKCTFCPKMFKTGVQLAGHKNSHIKPFNCTECNRPFASLYAVRAHLETHQRQNNLKYNCWLCGASYARAFALRDHFKEQHVGEVDNDVDIEALMVDPEHCKVPEVVESEENVLLTSLSSESVQSTNVTNPKLL